MKNPKIPILICASFFFASRFSFSQVKKQSGPLDGNVFVIELFKEGKEKKYEDDELRFTPGCKFKSSLFVDWSFDKPGVYAWSVDSSSSESKIYTFSAKLSNTEEEVMTWSGTVKGEDIERKAEKANKRGKIQQVFTFTGKMKKKKKA